MSEQERLSRELRSRAEQVGGHPIDLSDVKRSASKMRWQQRAGAALVTAAVLAVGVPAGFAIVNNGSDSDGGTPPFATEGTGTPSPTETTGPTPPSGVSVVLTDAPRGAAPHLSWIRGKTLTTADGTTFTLPENYRDATAYRGGWLAIYVRNGSYYLEHIHDGGIDWYHGSDRFAVSLDRTQTSWWQDGKLTTAVMSGMGEGGMSISTKGLAHPVGYVDAGKVLYYTDGVTPGVYTTDFQTTERIGGNAVKATGVNQATHVAALQLADQYGGAGWELRNLDTGKRLWATQEYSLGQISTDGDYVLGYGPDTDGLGPRDVYVLTAAEGKPVAHFTFGDGSFASQVVWDGDSDDLVATVYRTDGQWQIARLTLGGDVESASAAVTGADTDPVFWLGSQP